MAANSKVSPSRFDPFLELMRLSNPVGSILVYFPHLIGSLFAACYSSAAPNVTPTRVVAANLILLPASALLHAAGCSWNDIVDADLDRLVARTKNRPIARGAITLQDAYIFTAAETLVWLCMLSLLSTRMIWWALPMILGTGLYPYAKRVTNYPSIPLGCILSYGIFLGSVALDLDPLKVSFQGSSSVLGGLICFFAAYALLVTSVDMIYAHQDLPDDIKAGIRSMAVTFHARPKTILVLLATLQLVLLAYAGQLLKFSQVYTTATCGGIAIANAYMIWSVDLRSSEQCWWWFQYGSMMMGTILSVGMSAEYLRVIGFYSLGNKLDLF